MLQEYVLVDYEWMLVECFRRSEGRFWIYEPFGEGETVRLECLEFEMAIATLYEDVTLGPRENDEV